MTSHRTISLKTALLAVFLAFAVPSPALASPLLGGYGGPGEGNQAILGSALIGGASGGSSGSGGGSGGSAGSSSGSGSGSGSSTGAATSAAGGEAEPAGSSRQGSTGGAEAEAKGGATGPASGRTPRARERSGKASGGAARAYPPYRDDVAQATSGGSPALGLSTADFAYVLFALAALAATALVTRRLAHGPIGGGGL
jgi:hypothetical protein